MMRLIMKKGDNDDGGSNFHDNMNDKEVSIIAIVFKITVVITLLLCSRTTGGWREEGGRGRGGEWVTIVRCLRMCPSSGM